MPIENSLEVEKQASVESDIKIVNEVLENERDIGILKGQLDELEGNLNVIQKQTSNIEQTRVESDIKIVNKVLENERDIGILKGQLDELKGNLNVIKKQTSNIEQTRVESDIKIVNEVLENERDIMRFIVRICNKLNS